jgi:1-acyl-sn-glycerol-3-phosphate acyltransferase
MPPFTLIARIRLLLVGLHLLYGALQAALLFRLAGTAGRQHLTRTWSRQLLTLLGIRVEADARDLARIGAGLLVGNHISFIDIFVINALLPSSFVAKSEVAGWPLIGWLSRHAGTVFIERGNRKAAHRTHQQMLRLLGAGQRLAIFPEGTSTAGDTVMPFHAALFQSAIDAAVPVHAIALGYRGPDGLRSAAPAYIGDISLMECLLSILHSGPLVAQLTLAASFDAPLPDRRHLAHRAHHAVAATLARAAGSPHPYPDPSNKGRNPQNGGLQHLRNDAAIMP